MSLVYTSYGRVRGLLLIQFTLVMHVLEYRHVILIHRRHVIYMNATYVSDVGDICDICQSVVTRTRHTVT